MTTNVEKAVERFSEGFSCSQATFSAFAPGFGVPDETALRIASAFGGGIGRRGHVCGAVTGALMALGLARGHADNTEASKSETYAMVDEFTRRFEAEYGSLICRTLLGHAIDTPEGMQAARDSGAFKTVCPGLVSGAAAIVEALLERR
jgi:C_GCAxxG_C_C family probable redox protein